VGYSEWGWACGRKEPTERRAKVLWGCSIQTLHQTRDIQAVIHTPEYNVPQLLLGWLMLWH